MSAAHALRVQRPVPALSDHVECYWAGRSAGREGARELVLPNAAMSLVFSIDDCGRAASVLTGPHSQPISLDASRDFTAIGVKFKVGGAFPFLETISAELHNRIVRLDDLWGRGARDWEEQVWEAPTLEAKFRVIQEALCRRLACAPSPHPGVTHAVRAIDRSRGSGTVATLAEEIGISARRLAQLFAR